MVASGDDIESLCQILTGNLREGSVKMASAQKKGNDWVVKLAINYSQILVKRN